MNVLFLTAWYPVKNTPHKGIFVREHASAIAGSGHAVCVVALDVSHGSSLYTRKHDYYEDGNNVETHVISIHSSLYKKLYAFYPLLERSVIKYVNRNIAPSFQPDIVHSNVLYPAALIGTELAKKFQAPHVITEHWSKAAHFLKHNAFAAKGKRSYRESSGVTFVSEFLREQMAEITVLPPVVKIIPNVVQSEIFAFKPKIEHDILSFVAVATWAHPKRPDLFIHALRSIAQETGRKIELHLFGDGDLLNGLINHNFPVNFEIIRRGFCAKEIIAAQLQTAHFMLHASEVETFSIVVAEALSTGTPVIASRRGALPELINDSNGMLCENTAEEWERTIRSAIATEYNYEAISKAIVGKYSKEAIGMAFSDLYRKIILRS